MKRSVVSGLWQAVGAATNQFLKARGSRKPRMNPEAQLAGIMPGFGTAPTGYTLDKLEQVRRFRGWQYIGAKVIGEEMGMNPPCAGRIVADASKVAKKRLLATHLRRKSYAPIQQHEEIELADSSSPLMRLLKNPNGPDTCYTFFYRTGIFLELTGEAYWWKVRNGLREVVELWPLFSQWVTPRPGNDRLIDHYEIRPMAYGWNATKMFTLPPEDVVAFCYPSPLTLINGHSPLQACAEWADIDEAIESSQWYAFENGNNPGMVIALDSKVFGEKPIPIDQLNRFYAVIQNRIGGREKHRMPLVLNPGMEAAPWNNSPHEMDYQNSADASRDRVLAINRVSKTIAGLTDDVKYANLAGSLANFINRTMAPKYKFMGEIITEQLCRPDFGEESLVYWQNNAPPDAKQVNEDIDRDQKGGAITPNEQRIQRGREPFEFGGDDPIVNGVEMPWGTGEISDAAQTHQEWTAANEQQSAELNASLAEPTDKHLANGHGTNRLMGVLK